MEIDVKVVNSAIIAGVPALILAVGALVTARSITRNIEKMKLDSQEALEKQRLEFQRTIERERMEFQRDSELQKQRMELYKSLYLERIRAINKLMEDIGTVRDAILKYKDERYPDFTEEDFLAAIRPMGKTRNESGWLFNGEVNNAITELVIAVGSYYITIKYDNANEEEVLREDSNVSKHYDKVSQAVANMMQKDDLSRLVNPPH